VLFQVWEQGNFDRGFRSLLQLKQSDDPGVVQGRIGTVLPWEIERDLDCAQPGHRLSDGFQPVAEVAS